MKTTNSRRIVADELRIQAERLGKIAAALARAKTRGATRSAALAARQTSRVIAALVR